MKVNIKANLQDHHIQFTRQFYKLVTFQRIKLYINDVLLLSGKYHHNNTISYHKRLYINSIIKISYLNKCPDFYFYSKTNMLVSPERYKPIPLFYIIGDTYKLFNTYPYKSDLCYYQFLSKNLPDQYNDQCFNVKCLNLCENFIFYINTEKKEYTKVKISIVGQSSVYEGEINGN